MASFRALSAALFCSCLRLLFALCLRRTHGTSASASSSGSGSFVPHRGGVTTHWANRPLPRSSVPTSQPFCFAPPAESHFA